MATVITSECINCGACEPECPNAAISSTPTIFVVDPEKCTECVGAFDSPKCVEVCPVDCVQPDPNWVETKEQLKAKYDRMH